MYDRSDGERELEFEASGGLLEASLVMRDRQTDSWWSIMTGSAIGGPLEGEGLRELPIGEKTTWADWRKRHPETLVLSVAGREHVARDPYEDYFASDRTFRDLEIQDRRLDPKTHIFSFRVGAIPYAVPHTDVEGGALFELPEDRRVFLYRETGAPFLASTHGYVVPADLLESRAGRWWLGTQRLTGESLDTLETTPGVRKMAGFDTYWYTWIAVNEHTVLLQK